MIKIGDKILIKHSNEEAIVFDIKHDQYIVLTVSGDKETLFVSQLEPINIQKENFIFLKSNELKSLITAKLFEDRSNESFYSFGTGKIKFMPFQYRPLLKMIQSDNNRILIADSVGVGKTIEAALILKELETRINAKSILIICPKPLISEKKWFNELKRFDEHFTHVNGDFLRTCINDYKDFGDWNPNYSKIIIPYSLFDEKNVFGSSNGGTKQLKCPCLKDLVPFPKFDIVIVDEAHHIKNPETYAYKGVKMFCDNAKSVVLMSATPIMLGNDDLFTLLNLLDSNLVSDKKTFEYMLEPNKYITLASKEIRYGNPDWKSNALRYLQSAQKSYFGSKFLSSNKKYIWCCETLAKKEISNDERVKLLTWVETLHSFNNLINRTRRRDIGEKFTFRSSHNISTIFSPEQKKLYDMVIDFEAKILTALHGDSCIKFMMTTILRQASSCIFGLIPFLQSILSKHLTELDSDCLIDSDSDNLEKITNINVKTSLDSPYFQTQLKNILEYANTINLGCDQKFEKLLKIIKEKNECHNNNKIIIFSSFIHTLDYLHKKLTNLGYRVGLINGKVKDFERVELRKLFMKNKNESNAIDILLFSEVGCEGLDYQFCDCLINYDLPWNPQKIEQRIGRIDRTGQKSEVVSIYNIITQGTIDYDIFEKCLKRIGVFESSLGDSEIILSNITTDIVNIVTDYTLTPSQKREQLDAKTTFHLRNIQELQNLEKHNDDFTGVTISDEQFAKELNNKTNDFLSNDAIKNLLSQYFEKSISKNIKFIDNSLVLNLNNIEKQNILKDFNAINFINSRFSYRKWLNFLENDETTKYELTFDSDLAENNGIDLLNQTHPIVVQATKYLLNVYNKTSKTKICKIKIVDQKYGSKNCYLGIYLWKYKGLKDKTKIKIISNELIDQKEIISILFNSKDWCCSDINDFSNIDVLHSREWNNETYKYIEDETINIDDKISKLNAKKNIKESYFRNIISKTTDQKIIKMRLQQLENVKISLDKEINKLESVKSKLTIIAEPLIMCQLKIN